MIHKVAIIIEKLPPLVKDFKSYLKHKYNKMTFKNIIVYLRIKENKKVVEKRLGNSVVSKVNIVEDDPTNSEKERKHLDNKEICQRRNSKEIASIVGKLITRL